MIVRLTLSLAICAGLWGCSQKAPENKKIHSLSVASAGSQAFLIDNDTGQIYRFANGEFVESPIISAKDFSGKNGLRTFQDAVPKFKVYTLLKYYNGKLYYQVSVSPEFTPAYVTYLVKEFEAVSKKAPIPPEPLGPKYVDPNWTDVLDRIGNRIDVGLVDSDGFAVANLDLIFAGIGSSQRTNIVDTDSSTRTSVQFEGSIDMTGAEFVRIHGTNVTYVLN